HELEQRAWQLAGQLAELFLELQPLDRLGDLAHRALVVEQLAGLPVPHRTRRFGDPDALAAFVAVDLGDEILDLAVALEDGAELVASRRLDVPLPGDVLDAGNLLGLARIAVQP